MRRHLTRDRDQRAVPRTARGKADLGLPPSMEIRETSLPSMADAHARRLAAQLRGDIEAVFRRARASSMALGRGNRASVDLRELVCAYLPVGTPLEEARSLLRSGGFGVTAAPPPNSPAGSDAPGCTLLADITLEEGFGYRIWVAVELDADRPGPATSKIGAVRAAILYSVF